MDFTQINEKAAASLVECKEFLKDIIAIRSVSAEEAAVIDRIQQEMIRVGFDEVKTDGFGNVMGRVGHGPRQIAFDAHIDTVDVGNPELWKTKPFEPVELDGVIYGRGASDQKAGMAAMVYAARVIKELGLAPEFSVWMVGSVQEEDCDGLCWQYILREKVLDPEVVVLTEPTNLNIYRGHRGRMELEVETSGLSCHGSDPTRGDNAVTKMGPIIAEIDELNKRLPDKPFLGKGTVAISHIRSTSPSLCAVADSCTIHLDRRLTVDENADTAVAEILALPSAKAAGAKVRVLDYDVPSWKGTKYPTKKFYPTWVLDEQHQAVQSAVEAGRGALGREPRATSPPSASAPPTRCTPTARWTSARWSTSRRPWPSTPPSWTPTPAARRLPPQ